MSEALTATSVLFPASYSTCTVVSLMIVVKSGSIKVHVSLDIDNLVYIWCQYPESLLLNQAGHPYLLPAQFFSRFFHTFVCKAQGHILSNHPNTSTATLRPSTSLLAWLSISMNAEADALARGAVATDPPP
jgi:hypothetical protein